MRKILIVVLFFLTLASFGQQSSLNSDGLVVHPFNLDSTDPNELSYLDSIFKPYKILGVAEYHWSSIALKVEKKFISYLSKTKGLDKIVIERPYSYGYWINKYLDSGDTVLLKKVTDKFWSFDYYHNKTIRYINYYEFYKWLYALKTENQLSFEVVGIDLDQSRNGALELWTVKQFLDKYSLSQYFSISYPELEKICLKEEPKLSELKRWNNKFIKELAENNKITRQKLGNTYTDFSKVVNGIVDILNYGKLGDHIYRENRLAERFKEEIDPKDIVYAQFGHGHLIRSFGKRTKVTKGSTSFFILLEKDPKFSGSILSISLVCKECLVANYRVSNSWIYTQEEYDKIFNVIKDKSVLIDFRNAKNEFTDIFKYFQLAIFLTGDK